MLIQFWCNGIISNQVRGFVCSPGFIRDERNEEKWQQYFVITNQANWISQPFIALHSKKSNNPFASVWIVNRGITFYHCSVSDSRVRYFSWPGHGGVTRCHAVTINNTNVPLSGGQILCREDLVRQSIDCWNFLKCSALSMFSVSTLVMIDQMPRLQFSINLSRVASPDLEASCLLCDSLNGRAILGTDVWRLRVPACQPGSLDIIIHLYLEH